MSEKAKWTPGPWRVSGSGYVVAVKGGSVPIKTVFREDAFSDGHWATSYTREEVEANARLIASAPELAAFIKELASDRDDCISPGWKQKAQELIAKVEGGKP